MKLVKLCAIACLTAASGFAVSDVVIIDGASITTIPGDEIDAIQINPTTGDVEITAPGWIVTVDDDDGGDNGGGDPTGPDVVINSFTASSTEVEVGESINLSWIVSDADSCTPEVGTAGWQNETITLPTGTSSDLVMGQIGSFTFRLRCQNDTPSERVRIVTVNVTSVSTPTACEGLGLPNTEIIEWSDLVNDQWPDPRNWEEVITMPRYGSFSVRFVTDSVPQDGGFATTIQTSTPGIVLGAISECPGDFSEAIPQNNLTDCTQVWGVGGQVSWSTEGAGALNYECVLEPNTEYFINLTFSDGQNQANTSCTGSPCRRWLRIWN